MRLEDMEYEFPKMPEDMRTMVQREVEKQIKTTSTTQYRKRKGMARKSFLAALVAAMALGTTVFAGVAYHMHSESVGKYAVETKIDGNGTAAVSDTEATDTQTPIAMSEIPAVKMEVDYLPEGMVETETGKYSYEDALYQGGVSILFYRMDTGDDQFQMITNNVLSSEDITLNGYDGVYLELNTLGDGISFNQRIYAAYTDIHYVMEMYVASDVSKEDAVKIAESVKLIPVENGEGEDIVSTSNWSEYLAALEEKDDVQISDVPSVSKKMMQNTHAIGETFSAENMGLEPQEGLMLKVKEVQVTDDISLLDLSVMEDDDKRELQEETDADGKLLKTNINYIKNGDGVNSISEVVESREVPQKLVYVTVEYMNTGDTELSDILYYGELVKIVESENQMRIYLGEEPKTGDTWDVARSTGLAGKNYMYYSDVRGGEGGKNYITSIKPGESATVHMAWLVPEEELGYLYLSLDTFGGANEFSGNALQMGYVDIRQ